MKLVLLAIVLPSLPASFRQDTPQEALNRHVTAAAEHSRNRAWREAVSDYEQAITIAREAGSKRVEDLLRERQAGVRGELATLELEKGDYRNARSEYRRVLADALDLGLDGFATRANYQLAKISRLLGELADAEKVLLDVLDEGSETLEGPELTVVWNELGPVYKAWNRPDQRSRCLEASLDLALDSDDDARIAEVMMHFVELYESIGQSALAAELQEQVLILAERSGDPRMVALGLANLAHFKLHQGDAREAFSSARAACERVDVHADDVARLALRDTIARAALALSDHRTALETLREAECLIDRSDRGSLTPDERSRWRARHGDWERTGEDLVAARCSTPSSEDARHAVIWDGLLRAERWKARALLESLRAETDPDAGRLVDIDSMRTALTPPGTLLIEFAPGWNRLYAYVVSNDGLSHVDLGPREELEAQARSYVADLVGRKPPHEIARHGRTLFDRLLRPLLRSAPDGIELVIIPTTELSGLPFEALVVDAPEGGRKVRMSDLTFVLDAHVVRYAPSCGVLIEISERPRRDLLERTLVIADPDYGDEHPRLSHTRDEAMKLAKRILMRHEATTDQVLGRLTKLGDERHFLFDEHPALKMLVGDRAQPGALQGDLAEYSLIYVAAHGLADAEYPERTCVILSGNAGAAELSLASVRDLELEAELVVLSGCETALGSTRPGEGVLSMTRAFLAAGSRSVVASLWSLYDDKIAQTLESFQVGLIEQGIPPSRALREAKLSLRREPGMRSLGKPVEGATAELETTHPFYWAPFIYVGP